MKLTLQHMPASALLKIIKPGTIVTYPTHSVYWPWINGIPIGIVLPIESGIAISTHDLPMTLINRRYDTRKRQFKNA